MERFDKYVFQCLGAVELLHVNGMWVQSASLAYIYIDHMCWLSVDGKNSPSDFKAWVDKYMLGNRDLGFTSNDLWEGRNALLHMGTAESDRWKERNADRIIFYRKMEKPVLTSGEDFVFVNLDQFIFSFLEGLLQYRLDIEADVARKDIVDRKVSKFLLNTPT